MFNIKDYGAVGDGVTDDYEAIFKACYDAMKAHGTVYVPLGYYRLTETLKIRYRCNFLGEGPGSVLIMSEDLPLLYACGDSGHLAHQSIKNMAFYSLARSLDAPVVYLGQGVQEAVVEDVQLYGGYTGIHLHGTIMVVLSRVHFMLGRDYLFIRERVGKPIMVGKHAIKITNRGRSHANCNSVRDCRCTGSYDYGLCMNNTDGEGGLRLDNLIVEGNKERIRGIHIANTDGVFGSNLHFEGPNSRLEMENCRNSAVMVGGLGREVVLRNCKNVRVMSVVAGEYRLAGGRDIDTQGIVARNIIYGAEGGSLTGLHNPDKA